MKKATYSRTKNSLLNLITGVGGQLLMSVLRFVSRTVFIQVLGASYLGIGGLFSNILTLLSLTELGLILRLISDCISPCQIMMKRVCVY